MLPGFLHGTARGRRAMTANNTSMRSATNGFVAPTQASLSDRYVDPRALAVRTVAARNVSPRILSPQGDAWGPPRDERRTPGTGRKT